MSMAAREIKEPQAGEVRSTGVSIEDQFEKIVEDNGRRLYNVVYGMVGNREDTEEIVQETFLRAYKSYGRFEGRSQISTWLYRIAVNAVSDYRRKNAKLPMVHDGMSLEEREQISGLPSKSDTLEKTYAGMESLEEIKATLLKMPLNYRAVFVLNAVEGYSHIEIAKILGIKAGTARIRLFRAMEILRKELMSTGGMEGE